MARWLGGVPVIAAVLLVVASGVSAQPVVSEVIDAAGDHAGHALLQPGGIVVDSTGNVFVAAYGSNDVLQRTPAGVITAVLDATGDGAGHALFGPDDLALAPDQSIVVAGLGSRNVLQRTPGDVVTELIGPAGDGVHALLYPHRLAVDVAGNTFVADPLANRVFRIDPLGAITTVLDSTGDGLGHALSEPGAMVADSAGNLYVAGERSHNIFRVTPAGIVTQVADAAAPLDFPTALALDAGGNLYVGDFGGFRLLRISSGGAITVLAAGLDPVAVRVRGDGVVLVAESNFHRIIGIRPDGPPCTVIDQAGDGVHPFGFATYFALAADDTVLASNVSFDGVFAIEGACPAAPPIDPGGRWRLSITYPPNPFYPPPPTVTYLTDWALAGFDLTMTDPTTGTVTMRGTLDDRARFLLSSLATVCAGGFPSVCCPAHDLYGTLDADGRSWSGTYTDNFLSLRLQCSAAPAPPAVAFASRCGNGLLEPPETCDDGNWTPDDGCDAACGLGSLCGNGVLEPGEGCDDGNRIASDGCSADCRQEGCGDGIVNPVVETCDDGNTSAGDGCDGSCHVEPCFQCTGSPSLCDGAVRSCGGMEPGAGKLTWRPRRSARVPSLHWHGKTNASVTPAALGDPATGTDYHLCVFDESGASPHVLASGSAPAGSDWSAGGAAFRYRSTRGTESTKIAVRSGAVGKIAVQLEADLLPAPPVPIPLRLQLQTSDAACFEARFTSAGIRKNDPAGVRATSTP